MLLVVIGSGVHYVDNVARFERYVDPTNRFGPTSWIDRYVVALSWFVFAGAMVWGLRRFEAGHRTSSALALAVGSSGGLLTLLHFTEVPPSAMDWFQLVGIVADFTGGLALLGCALWIALHPADVVPTRSVTDEVEAATRPIPAGDAGAEPAPEGPRQR